MRDVEAEGGWTRVVRGEYLEIPGLQLTQRQAQRLWGLDEQACESILQTLIDEGFLRRTPEGRYVRTDTGRPSDRPSVAATDVSTVSELTDQRRGVTPSLFCSRRIFREHLGDCLVDHGLDLFGLRFDGSVDAQP